MTAITRAFEDGPDVFLEIHLPGGGSRLRSFLRLSYELHGDDANCEDSKTSQQQLRNSIVPHERST